MMRYGLGGVPPQVLEFCLRQARVWLCDPETKCGQYVPVSDVGRIESLGPVQHGRKSRVQVVDASGSEFWVYDWRPSKGVNTAIRNAIVRALEVLVTSDEAEAPPPDPLQTSLGGAFERPSSDPAADVLLERAAKNLDQVLTGLLGTAFDGDRAEAERLYRKVDECYRMIPALRASLLHRTPAF